MSTANRRGHLVSRHVPFPIFPQSLCINLCKHAISICSCLHVVPNKAGQEIIFEYADEDDGEKYYTVSINRVTFRVYGTPSRNKACRIGEK